jgi:RNA polymerase sigma-70 factor (ECF subfamily)
MSDDLSFRDLILRLRAGDEAAATELLRRYEPSLRRTVRVRFRDPQLRRLLDSQDICQSVFHNFFVRVAAGQFELDQPEQLLKLLATMARNKIINQAEALRAQRRDYRRVEAGGLADGQLAAPGSTPSQQVAARELLQETHRRLSEEERRLLDLRQQGREWSDIAAELGGSPEALRKQLARAINRVGRELGLDEVADE